MIRKLINKWIEWLFSWQKSKAEGCGKCGHKCHCTGAEKDYPDCLNTDCKCIECNKEYGMDFIQFVREGGLE